MTTPGNEENTVTDHPTVHEAIRNVMGKVQSIRKDQQNNAPGGGYMFRGIDAVINKVGPVLREEGVYCAPVDIVSNYRDVQTSTGKPSRECTVKVTWRITGPDGSSFDAMTPGESMDFGDKGAPKAMSVAYRILWLQLLCIPTDEPEHDPDASTYQRDAGPTPDERREANIADAKRVLWKMTEHYGTNDAAVEDRQKMIRQSLAQITSGDELGRMDNLIQTWRHDGVPDPVVYEQPAENTGAPHKDGDPA